MIQEDPSPRLDFSMTEVEVSAPKESKRVARQALLHVPGEGKYMVDGVKMSVFEEIPLASPWDILFQQTDTGAWQYGIIGDSDVYDGITWKTCTVTGLLEDKNNVNDPGWKTPKKGFVFLWGTVEDGKVTKIEVKNDQESLADIKRVDSEAGKQTQFAFVIGYLWSEGTGDALQWYVRQEAFRHVTLMYVVVNGVLCKVPFEM